MNNEIPHLSDYMKFKRIEFANKIEKVCRDTGIKAKITEIKEFCFMPPEDMKWFNHNTLGWVDD